MDSRPHEARLEAVEKQVAEIAERIAEVDKKAAMVEAAQKSWRVVAQMRNDLLFTNDLGETARLPLHVATLLAAGRALDLDVKDVSAERIAFVDEGSMVCELPRALLVVLSRTLENWVSRRPRVTSPVPRRGVT